RIAGAADEVLAALRGADFKLIHTYDHVPYVAVELSPAALRTLRLSGRAATLQEDTLDAPTLSESTVLVEATESAALSRTGSGRHVAILDTGVDKAHTFLQQTSSGPSKVVSEACYSDGDCPGGVSSSTASGSGVPCTYAASACQHGTHVAGIAAGRSMTVGGK